MAIKIIQLIFENILKIMLTNYQIYITLSYQKEFRKCILI